MNHQEIRCQLVAADEAVGFPEIFRSAFAHAEGETEGQLIAALVSDILADTAESDLRRFLAVQGSGRVAAICFTRLRFKPSLEAFLLSPVAVLPEHQGQGIGQALIRFGLKTLRLQGVQWVFTYGDPAYYQRLGFAAADTALAPYPLSQPIGWVAQALTENAPSPMSPASCVSAFQRPEIW